MRTELHDQKVAALLNEFSSDILESWINSVQEEITSARFSSRDIVRDHIHNFLKDLTGALNKTPQSPDNVKDAGAEHGKQRSSLQQYSLHKVISEYGILRKVIFDFLDSRIKVEKSARDIINISIDAAIRESACEYEDALKEKESMVQKQSWVLSAASDLMWMFDEKMRFTYVNRSLLDLWSKTEEESLGKTLREMVDNPEVVKQLEEDAAKAFKGETLRAETPYVSPKGMTGYFEYILSPVKNEKGEVIAVSGISRDISEKKQLELELKNARNDLYEFFMQAPAPLVILTGEELKFAIANPPYERLVGRKVQGKTVLEAFSEEEIGYFIPLARGVMETGEPYIGTETPLNIPGPDGTLKTLYLNFGYHPFREADGTIKGVLAVVQDVTEQVLAKQKLETILEEVSNKNNEMLQILNSIDEGFFVLDENFIIKQINSRHEEITKIPPSQQLGKSFFELFGKDESSRVYLNNYHMIMKERVAVSFDEYYAPLDIWTAVNVYPKEDGGIAVFYRDITERKRALSEIEGEKQKLETVFADSPASMAILKGKDFIFEKVNAQYAALFPERNLLNCPIGEIIPEFSNSPLQQIMKSVFETGEPFIGREVLFPYVKEGQITDVWFDFTYSRINDGSGKPYGIYIHAMDVTQKVLARQALEASEKSLRDAVKARDEFLSVASHELKTPLTSMKLQAQSAGRKFKKGGISAFSEETLHLLLDKNVQQVDRLVRLVDDMLDLSRAQSGKLSYQFQELNLKDVVFDVGQRFKETFDDQNTPFSVTADEDVIVSADKERIEQVITNLLTNAMKYGRKSPVIMSVHRVPGFACIKVQDQGIGIKPENFEKIFQRFERLISPDEVSGLGIGLYITKQIIDAHSGKVRVESGEGKGSTFLVELPLKEGQK